MVEASIADLGIGILGELVHFDIKQLGRSWQVGKRALGDGIHHNPRAGWQYLHLAIDDHSRFAVAQIRPTQTSVDSIAFLDHAKRAFAERGVQIERIMSDNGSCYVSGDFRRAAARQGVRHVRTPPYTPRTNGKAEALVGILLREWAYGYIWNSSSARARALPGYLRWYNTHRAHGTTGVPPLSRVSQAQRSYS